MKISIKLYIFLIIFFVYSCSSPNQDNKVVAHVGKEKIFAEDLILSFELLPNWKPSKHGLVGLRTHLDLLIEKKMFAQEGRKKGFDKDPEVIKMVNWIKNEQLRKALYRTNVEEKIEVTEKDLLLAFYKNNVQLHVKHLFAKTKEEINAIQKALGNGLSWEDVAKATFTDSTLANNGGDLGWISFGDMDFAFEDSAFSQPIGEISHPVRSKYGYHLIQVIDSKKNILLSKDDFEASKPKLEKALFQRREKELADDFVKNFMAKKDLKMINKTFDFLVAKIRDFVIDKRKNEIKFLPSLQNDELTKLSSGLENYYNEVLITFKGGNWTIGDFVEKLSNIPVMNRPRLDNPFKFRHDLGIMIRNDFLTQQAKKLGLEKDGEVLKDVKHWEDEFIFSRLWKSIKDTIATPEKKLKKYFENHHSRYWLPERVKVQEILVKNESLAKQIIARLRKGEKFSNLVKTYSLRKTDELKNGELGWIYRGQMGNISTAAFKLNKGEISAPIKADAGFSIIKVLQKQNQRDKTFPEAEKEVIKDLKRELSSKAYRHWVQKLKSKTKIVINDSLLHKLSKELDTGYRVVMPGVRGGY